VVQPWSQGGEGSQESNINLKMVSFLSIVCHFMPDHATLRLPRVKEKRVHAILYSNYTIRFFLSTDCIIFYRNGGGDWWYVSIQTLLSKPSFTLFFSLSHIHTWLCPWKNLSIVLKPFGSQIIWLKQRSIPLTSLWNILSKKWLLLAPGQLG
jgi:hypothetical protein